ncbi:MAG: hypothetical protein AB1512_25250 [Thermodesulfobacteriota bacterium]
MKKWRLVGGVALVFALGVLAGSLGFHYYDRQRSERFWKDPTERRARLMHKLTEQLALTGEQQRELEAIIGDMDRKIEALRSERRLQKIIDEGFARMKERLTPDQRVKLDDLRARHEERVKDRKRKSHFL